MNTGYRTLSGLPLVLTQTLTLTMARGQTIPQHHRASRHGHCALDVVNARPTFCAPAFIAWHAVSILVLMFFVFCE